MQSTLERHGSLYMLMASEHAQLDVLLAKAAHDGGPVDPDAYQQFRELLLRHIRIEERILLPMAQLKRGAPLAIAPRLRLDHGAMGALVMLPPSAEAFRALRAVLDAHNPLEEREGGAYEECESIAGSELNEVHAKIKAMPRVPVSAWVNSHRVLEAAQRVFARAGYDPALLTPETKDLKR